MIPHKYGKKLLEIFKKRVFKGKKVLVAFSGGVDSTLVLLISLKYAVKVIPVFINSPIFSKSELEFAGDVCSAFNIQLQIIDLNPLEDTNFKSNPPDRCYFCKKMIMDSLVGIKTEMNFDNVVEGTNISEIEDEKLRPGYRALKEFGVVSPLIEGNFQKDEVRSFLGYINENLDEFFGEKYSKNKKKIHSILNIIKKKPPSPCLCSRIEYNLPITPKILKKIEEAEFFLKKTFNLADCRVRFHQNSLVRIELIPKDFDKIITLKNYNVIIKKFKELGFKYITLDLEGLRSGSLNL
ncbi:MAG: ATP-dependent sacrificial sulfur transferase LarE [Promethearchaeota archaeon]